MTQKIAAKLHNPGILIEISFELFTDVRLASLLRWWNMHVFINNTQGMEWQGRDTKATKWNCTRGVMQAAEMTVIKNLAAFRGC